MEVHCGRRVARLASTSGRPPSRSQPPRSLAAGAVPSRRVGGGRPTAAARAAQQSTTDRAVSLARVQAEVEAGRRGCATQLARELKESGVIEGFSGGRLIPKRSYTLQDLRLNKIEPAALLSPRENYLDKVSSYCRRAYLVGAVSASFALHWDVTQVFYLGAFTLGLLTVDKVGYNGGIEFLAVDTIGRLLSDSYVRRVSRHEAGHFLVAYLMGVLPSGYTLSAWNALRDGGDLSIQAGTAFCDDDFQKEVASGKLSSGALDKFCCIALAGVGQEFIDHGCAEGGMNDISQLDYLLQGLGFSQKKADDQVRWSALNTVLLLRQHQGVIERLAEEMVAGAPLSRCILTVEESLVLE
eukprot:CAMPEP_0197509840 /NCGR_PEP_ID=MMETSP1312-20131121/45770_1 /TAXON_ID=464262 /ORGANISM="Genus nov. species nov., Strain RCC2335" /LENGTH=354 /DNA_ID=CAMNT_0043057745 /DNA_START=18 /DNA_END=1085 /DNA_ORIENTATION=+